MRCSIAPASIKRKPFITAEPAADLSPSQLRSIFYSPEACNAAAIISSLRKYPADTRRSNNGLTSGTKLLRFANTSTPTVPITGTLAFVAILRPALSSIITPHPKSIATAIALASPASIFCVYAEKSGGAHGSKCFWVMAFLIISLSGKSDLPVHSANTMSVTSTRPKSCGNRPSYSLC